MSDKPSIYGTCPAGCQWETVHKSDLEDGTFKPLASEGVKNQNGGDVIKKWIGTQAEYDDAVAASYDFTDTEITITDEAEKIGNQLLTDVFVYDDGAQTKRVQEAQTSIYSNYATGFQYTSRTGDVIVYTDNGVTPPTINYGFNKLFIFDIEYQSLVDTSNSNAHYTASTQCEVYVINATTHKQIHIYVHNQLVTINLTFTRTGETENITASATLSNDLTVGCYQVKLSNVKVISLYVNE